MRYSFYTLVLLLFILLQSCQKELDLWDDYDDHVIVYSLLDPNDSISYIRIEKAYLTHENILDPAQIQDSNQFAVKLEVVLTSGSTRIVFDTTTLTHKEEGIFYAPNMLVYYAQTQGLLNTNDEYYLEITHPKTGKVTRSSVKLHDSSRLRAKQPHLYINFEEDDDIIYESIEDIKYYQLLLRFHYMTLIPGDTNTREYHYFDWTFPPEITQYQYADQIISIPYEGRIFYELIKNNIEPNPDVEFYYGNVDFIMHTGDLTFYYYMQSITPDASIIIHRKVFTNIENGDGFLAGKSAGIAEHRLSNNTKTHLRNLPDYNFVGGF